MTDFLSQIVLYLTAAALSGVALGWLLGNYLRPGRSPRSAKEAGVDNRQLGVQLDEARMQLKRQEAALVESRAALDDKDGAFVQLRQRFDSVKNELSEARAAFAGLEFEAESLKRRLRDAEAGLSAAATSIEERERRVDAAEAQIQQVEARASELAEEALRLRKRTSELSPVVDLHERLREEHQRLKVAFDQLKQENARLQRDATREAGTTPVTPFPGKPARALKITPVIPPATATSAANATSAATDSPVSRPAIDDLKKIRGIGEVLEGRLRELGYQTYKDIAQMTPADVKELCIKLDGFGDRITRDGWVDQAKVLARE